jgi:hypothetical protein
MSEVLVIKKTVPLDLEHEITSDEVQEFVEYKRKQKEFREKITQFEQAVVQHPSKVEDVDEVNPLRHSFADGQYIRQMSNPAGVFIVTKIHNKNHPFFLMKGEMTIFSENGLERISAPYQGITRPGTKRAMYTHTECIFITVHATDKLNIDDVEDEVIAKSFEDVNLLPPDVEQVEKLICQIKEKQTWRLS